MLTTKATPPSPRIRKYYGGIHLYSFWNSNLNRKLLDDWSRLCGSFHCVPYPTTWKMAASTRLPGTERLCLPRVKEGLSYLQRASHPTMNIICFISLLKTRVLFYIYNHWTLGQSYASIKQHNQHSALRFLMHNYDLLKYSYT